MNSSKTSEDSFVVLNAEEEDRVQSSTQITPSFLTKKLDQLNVINKKRSSMSQPNSMGDKNENGPIREKLNSMPIIKTKCDSSIPPDGYDAKVISEENRSVNKPSNSFDNFSYLSSIEKVDGSGSNSDNLGSFSTELARVGGEVREKDKDDDDDDDNDDDDDDAVQSLEWMEEAQLLQVLECLTTVRKENEHLTRVLQSNNAVMKKNLDAVQKLKVELEESRSSFDKLKEDSDRTIEQLKSENGSLEEKYRQMARNECNHGISYNKLDVTHELELQHLTSQVMEKDRELTSLNNHLSQLKTKLNSQKEDLRMVSDLTTQLEYFMNKAKVEEEARIAAAVERAELEMVCQRLVEEKKELEEKLEKGHPVYEIGTSGQGVNSMGKERDDEKDEVEEETSSRHRRRRHIYRHQKRHHNVGRHQKVVNDKIEDFNRQLNKRMKETLPMLSKGLFLQGFKQYKK